ncbi:PaaI family thioesterase [Microvirga arabica]|uniref:PaaI family thioesterase n=1 Tax=Microvirga arabica TaxID=1128671 RepID=UPI0035E42275
MTGVLKIGSQHRSRAGNVHGGVLCSMIDFAACAVGLHSESGEPKRYGVTLSLTTQFTKAVSHARFARGGAYALGQLKEL